MINETHIKNMIKNHIKKIINEQVGSATPDPATGRTIKMTLGDGSVRYINAQEQAAESAAMQNFGGDVLDDMEDSAPAPAAPAPTASAPAPTASAPAPTASAPAPTASAPSASSKNDVERIKQIQRELIKIGFLPAKTRTGKDSADGIVGPATTAALQRVSRAVPELKHLAQDPAIIKAGKEYYAKGVTAPKTSAGREELAKKGRTLELQKLLFMQGFLPASNQTGIYDAATRAAVGQAYKKLGKVPAKGEPSSVSLKKLSQLYGVPVSDTVQPFAGDVQDKDVARQNIQTTKNMGMTPSADAIADLQEGKVVFKKSYVEQVIREEVQKILKKKV